MMLAACRQEPIQTGPKARFASGLKELDGIEFNFWRFGVGTAMEPDVSAKRGVSKLAQAAANPQLEPAGAAHRRSQGIMTVTRLRVWGLAAKVRVSTKANRAVQDGNTELIGNLVELAALSDKHGYSWHAAYIRETIRAFTITPDDGWTHLASAEFWGGSGSICDVSFNASDVEWHRDNGRPVSDELLALDVGSYRADNDRYMQLLSEISKTIPDAFAQSETLGRWVSRAHRIAEIYDDWLAHPTDRKIMRL